MQQNEFFLIECTKWLASLPWLSDTLHIIFLFELALFIYLLFSITT